MWRYSSFWYKNFDAMAKKTMLRQLISHWGAMNTEMQIVTATDNQVVKVTDENRLDLNPEDYPEEAEIEAEKAAVLVAAPEEEPVAIPVPPAEEPAATPRKISLGDIT